MSVQKAGEKMKREKPKQTLLLASLVFFATSLYCIFSDKTGFRKYSRGEPHSWPEVASRIPIYLIIGLIAAIISYFVRRNSLSDVVGCTECGKAKVVDGQTTCPCGGEIGTTYTPIYTGFNAGGTNLVREHLMKQGIPCLTANRWGSSSYVYVAAKDSECASKIISSDVIDIAKNMKPNYAAIAVVIGIVAAVVVALTFLTDR
jgi:hypothetical protein